MDRDQRDWLEEELRIESSSDLMEATQEEEAMEEGDCWTCVGTGTVQVAPDAWRACPECGGTGLEPPFGDERPP